MSYFRSYVVCIGLLQLTELRLCAQEDLDLRSLSRQPDCRDLGGNIHGARRVTIPAGTRMPDGTVLSTNLPAVLTHRYGGEYGAVVPTITQLANEGTFANIIAVEPPSDRLPGLILMEDMASSPSGNLLDAGTVVRLPESLRELPVSERILFRNLILARMAEHPDGHAGNVMYRISGTPSGPPRIEVKMVDPFDVKQTSSQIANLFAVDKSNPWVAQYHPEVVASRLNRQLALPPDPPNTVMYNIGRGYGMGLEQPAPLPRLAPAPNLPSRSRFGSGLAGVGASAGPLVGVAAIGFLSQQFPDNPGSRSLAASAALDKELLDKASGVTPNVPWYERILSGILYNVSFMPPGY